MIIAIARHYRTKNAACLVVKRILTATTVMSTDAKGALAPRRYAGTVTGRYASGRDIHFLLAHEREATASRCDILDIVARYFVRTCTCCLTIFWC